MINKESVTQILDETRSCTVVAATKYGGVEDISELVELGISNIGENRVQAFLEKYEVLHDLDITWHFIGHLQSKKVKQVIDKIDYLHSLDRLSLAEEIQKHRNLPIKCFVEVNISGEASKYGLDPSEVVDFCAKMQNYDTIHIVGLMGMASLTDDEIIIENQFHLLSELKDQINKELDWDLDSLSMGMSNDYKIAIRQGATHLRLGSILFRNEE
ncbi:MAG: YggS family pyridoxal phosphate-dependent enzyme [Bacilli bacterium]|nr:YggS family pyridoxal phosphate-dependent enzyme [Bacilli bacterium]MBN2877101.1 YggS family pyridoxal phosphate-dependent enzyme [Bacilli bacterium]